MASPSVVTRWVVLAVLALISSPGAAGAQPDHVKCYAVKDSLPRATYRADLGGLAAEPGCLVRVPARMLCVPSTKDNVMPPPPGAPLGPPANPVLCYKVKCPKAVLAPVAVADQFGSRSVTPAKAKLLCAPATTPTTVTTTTTTSTTSSTTPLPACSVPGASCGTCGPAGTCLAHVDPNPPPNVCVNGGACVEGACSGDAGCPAGQVCGTAMGLTACCVPCP